MRVPVLASASTIGIHSCFDPVRAHEGDPYCVETAPGGGIVNYDPIPIQLASSGSLNVRAHLPAVYIQTVVVDPTKIVAFSGVRGPKGKGKGKGK
jgi:hypothetical protein